MPTAGSSPPASDGPEPAFTLRILTPADAAAYRYLRLEALQEVPPNFGTLPADEAQVALQEIANRLVETPNLWIVGAFVGDRLIGMARFTRHTSASERHKAYVTSVYVTADWRRRGCARALLEMLISRARRCDGLRRLNLAVGTNNAGAMALYESVGFRRWGTEEEAYVRDGVSYAEHMMGLRL